MTDSTTTRLLLELLGNLTDASKKITDLIRACQGGTTSVGASVSAPATIAAEEEPDSALDRIQEYTPGPGDIDEEAPKKRGRRGKFNITEAELKKLYVEDGLTAKQIGEKYGVAAGTVAQRVMKLGLSMRGPSPMKGKKTKKK